MKMTEKEAGMTQSQLCLSDIKMAPTQVFAAAEWGQTCWNPAQGQAGGFHSLGSEDERLLQGEGGFKLKHWQQ